MSHLLRFGIRVDSHTKVAKLALDPSLHEQFAFQFDNNNSTVAELCDAELMKVIFIEKMVFDQIDHLGCTVLDVALAKSGSEAIIVDYNYSLMKSQIQSVGIYNRGLEL